MYDENWKCPRNTKRFFFLAAGLAHFQRLQCCQGRNWPLVHVKIETTFPSLGYRARSKCDSASLDFGLCSRPARFWPFLLWTLFGQRARVSHKFRTLNFNIFVWGERESERIWRRKKGCTWHQRELFFYSFSLAFGKTEPSERKVERIKRWKMPGNRVRSLGRLHKHHSMKRKLRHFRS